MATSPTLLLKTLLVTPNRYVDPFKKMRTADFDFALPPELIAQTPASSRDQSRLLVLERASGGIRHQLFSDLPGFFRSGDLLVLNDSKVIPARLRGTKTRTGGQFEVLLLEENSTNDWWAMVKPGKRAHIGTEISFRMPTGAPGGLSATVTETNSEGHRRLSFRGDVDVLQLLSSYGEVPLPPYIERAAPNLAETDRERYQTVYARAPGSVAAPTAGLHFTPELLSDLRQAGVEVQFVTLHVGLGTFAPVKSDMVTEHRMHEERYDLSEDTVRAIRECKRRGGRVFAVGTTTVRVLESVATRCGGDLVAGSGKTRIFIYPPYRFSIVDAMLTNFHLPCSTLLMLVSAFASPDSTEGREKVLTAYREAVKNRYRFFSYGDAMLLL